VVVYFHGGGWVLGNPRGYDPLCGYLADSVDVVVVSVDYRLAPEFVAPQGVQDCVDAVRWVGSSVSSLGGQPGRIAVCGDSAGGNLAAGVSLVLRDEGGPRIAHQALLYPGVDATMSFPSVTELADAPMLTRREIVAYLHRYLHGSGLDPKDPLVSPYWADSLEGLPPALVQTADLDPLRDEAVAYAARLTDAGVPVRATNYLRTPHGFMSIPGVTPSAAQARLELTTELRRHLA
jgi:acetyl esterase